MRPLMKIVNRDDEREQELRERATTLMNEIEAKVEKSFFIRTLLTRHVLSDRETLEKLDSLIRWLTIYGEAKEVK